MIDSSSNWRKHVHRCIESVSPRVADAARSAWRARHARRLEKNLGLSQLTKRYIAHHGLIVCHGPFEGMSYLNRAAGSVLIPKLIGCYEEELHLWLAQLQEMDFHYIVDIGAAEGYYAVGLARMFPKAEVTAYESKHSARRDCKRLSKLNKVEHQVVVRGSCDPKWLFNTLDSNPTLIVCDCEGCEWHLLDPDEIEHLEACHLIIELHKTEAIDDVQNAIEQRFELSHHVEILEQQSRDPARHPELDIFCPENRAKAVSELRNQQAKWAVLIPKNTTVSDERHEGS